jgi:flagellar biosynthesis protein FliR
MESEREEVTHVYTFAIVAMLGLAVWKVVGFLLGLVGKEVDATVRTFLTLGIGVLVAEILDYNAFAGWHATFRSSWMDPVFSGLVIGSMAYVWHNGLGALEGYGRRNRDEAREIERRAPHAA